MAAEAEKEAVTSDQKEAATSDKNGRISSPVGLGFFGWYLVRIVYQSLYCLQRSIHVGEVSIDYQVHKQSEDKSRAFHQTNLKHNRPTLPKRRSFWDS